MRTLTEADVEALKSPAGGWNAATLAALGVSWPPVSGWKKRLIGTQISDKRYANAVRESQRHRHFFRGNTRRQ